MKKKRRTREEIMSWKEPIKLSNKIIKFITKNEAIKNIKTDEVVEETWTGFDNT
jgi:hypothetical protein